MSVNEKQSNVQSEQDHQGNKEEAPIIQLESPEEFDFSSLRPAASKQGDFSFSQPSMLTIVNTEKNGKRIAIAPEIIQQIGSPSEVQILLNDKGLVISQPLAGGNSNFRLKTSGKKSIIYASHLVQEITNAFQMDFEGVTSLSFQNVQYIPKDNQIFAFVNLLQQG